MGYIVGGKVVSAACVDYHEEPQLKLKPGEDMRRRVTRWVRSIIVHTTKGIPTLEVKGVGPDTDLANRIARLWSTDHRLAGAHLSVDSNNDQGCHADLLYDAAYHAGSINEVSIGIEMYQDGEGRLYSDQLEATVKLVCWLCDYFNIPRQCAEPRYTGIIQRAAQGGTDLCGVFGHRHVGFRGPGDPGNQIFEHLIDHGFVTFDFNRKKDIKFWKRLQKEVGLRADGLPGPITLHSGAIKNTPLNELVRLF